ncbi:MAG: MATE family efflux transporter [Clostridiales bacterium]|nr:MATE family efflux transporter [Clostridiales bacterium]
MDNETKNKLPEETPEVPCQPQRSKSGIDMTEGVIWKQLVVFAIPLFLGLAFQNLYNIVDSIVVGKFVSSEALAAIGCSARIMSFMTAIFMGLSTGAGIIISQCYGSKDYSRLKTSIHSTMYLVVIVGVGTSVLGYFLSPWLLQLLGTPENVFAPALTYLRIIFIGMLANMAYNMAGGVLRSIGDSKNPLYFLIVASTLNAILALLFVIVFKWGVAGTALATVIAQSLSAVLAVWKITTIDERFRLNILKIRPEGIISLQIVKMGLPVAFQQAILSLGFLVVQGLINSFGYEAMAGNAAAQKIDMFLLIPTSAINIGFMTFVGQNIGAGNLKRVYAGLKTAIKINVTYTWALIPVLLFGSKLFLSFFTNEQVVIDEGVVMLYVLMPFYWVLAVQMAFSMVIRGSGNTLPSMLISLCSSIVGRIIIGYFLTKYFNNIAGVYWGIVADFVISAALAILYFRFGKWREKLPPS